MENRRMRLLRGPRVSFQAVVSTGRAELHEDFAEMHNGIYVYASFLTRRMIHITLENRSDKPFRAPHSRNDRFMFYLTNGKEEELLTEERNFGTDHIRPGFDSVYPIELSFAEAARIKRETVVKIRCFISGVYFVLMPLPRSA